MSDDVIRIERVDRKTQEGVQSVLAASGLMSLDTSLETTIALAACAADGRVIGCAAVEVYGRNGLLRSVAVHPDRRGQHLGQYLVAAAEAEATAAFLESIYLLTETADSFFDRLGYDALERSAVPEPVLASDQFARLCPSTAVAMHRSLTTQD